MNPNFHIIGAGVSGLSVALSLLKRGPWRSVPEAARAAAAPPRAEGAFLFPLLPWDYPDPLNALALRSMSSYEAWLSPVEASAGQDTEFWRCGMMLLDSINTHQVLSWCRGHYLTVEQVRHSPVTSTDANQDLRNALYLPQVAQVRNPRLIRVLVSAIKHQGGDIHEHCAITGFTTAARKIIGIQTAAHDWETANVVLATGAWAGLPTAGLPPAPHIRPIRGQMLLFKLNPGVLTTIIYRNGLYLIPRLDGHVLVGSTLEDAGFDKSVDMPTRQRLHAEAAELLPVLASVEPIQHWAGLRPGSPDNIPIIGRHPDFDNVFVNTGHYRYGVTMAPASAELLADLIEGKTPALDPEPYSWQAALARSWGDKL